MISQITLLKTLLANSVFFKASLSISLFFLCAIAVNADDSDPIRIAPKKVKPSSICVGEQFPKFTAKSIDGRKLDFADGKEFKATVIALTSTSCPVCKKQAPTLASIEKQFASKNIRFVFLNPLESDSLADINSAIKANELSGVYIHDSKERVSQILKARTTAEVFVFDSARTLVYRGAVDDQFGIGYSNAKPKKTYLIDALNSIVTGREIVTSATTAPGCDLWNEKDASPVASNMTYHNRISRIVQNNCVQCHREKGLAPFSLESADDIISHAGMIKTVVANGTMPPWFAKEEKESRWANDISLTKSNKQDLLAWLSSDRNLGDLADAPIPKKFENEWNIGTPDKIYQIPRKMNIQATGEMPYKYALIKAKIEKDTWIKSVEIRPSDPAVVHHVLVFARKGKGRDIDGTSGFFAAYVPGNSYQIYPDGFAKKLAAGTNLFVQLHYTPNGTRTTDQTKIGLNFYDGIPKHVIRNKGIANRGIRIPAGVDDHSETATLRVPTNVKLLSFMPHMHVRGKAFRYDLISDGQRKTLLDVPRYDFNWQLEYRLLDPLLVKQDSKIEVTGWYDNSENNPANPNPDLEVTWGDQTDEEMMLGYVEYYIPTEVVSANKTAITKPTDDVSREVTQNRANRRKVIAKAILIRTFKKYDKDNDGVVTRKELPRQTLFNSIDQNRDNKITVEELINRNAQK